MKKWKWTLLWKMCTRRKEVIRDWRASPQCMQMELATDIARELARYGPAVLTAYIREIDPLTPEKLRQVRQMRRIVNRAQRFIGRLAEAPGRGGA